MGLFLSPGLPSYSEHKYLSCYIKTAHSNCKTQAPHACKLEKNGYGIDSIVFQFNARRPEFHQNQAMHSGNSQTPLSEGKGTVPAEPPRLPCASRRDRQQWPKPAGLQAAAPSLPCRAAASRCQPASPHCCPLTGTYNRKI